MNFLAPVTKISGSQSEDGGGECFRISPPLLDHLLLGGRDGGGGGGGGGGLMISPLLPPGGGPDFLYSSMACLGVLVEVDLFTWTGGGLPFRPSNTSSADLFPLARSFSTLPDGVLVTSLGSFALSPLLGIVVTLEGCPLCVSLGAVLTFGEGFPLSAAVAPPMPRTRKNTVANTTVASLPMHPPSFEVALQSHAPIVIKYRQIFLKSLTSSFTLKQLEDQLPPNVVEIDHSKTSKSPISFKWKEGDIVD